MLGLEEKKKDNSTANNQAQGAGAGAGAKDDKARENKKENADSLKDKSTVEIMQKAN